jgi:fluoride exporter
MTFIAIGAAGLLGVWARYGVGLLLPTHPLSWSVLFVNVAGSFAAGWIYATKILPEGNSSILASAVLVGLLGGFTTFSAFALDTARLLQESQWALAIINVLVNNILSVTACLFGIRLFSGQ